MFDLALRWILLIGTVCVAVLTDLWLRKQVDDSDSGIYWSRVVEYCIYPLFAVLVIGKLLEEIIPGWPKYLTLYLDFEYPQLALLIPFIAWILSLIVCAVIKPAAESSRWLAGGVGHHNNRYWLGWCVLYLTIIIFSNCAILGYENFPSALWSALVVSAVTLTAIALSKGKRYLPAVTHAQSESRATQPLKPWSDLMKQAGFDLKPLATFASENVTSNVEGYEGYAQLASHLNELGNKAVDPELIKMAANLMQKNTPSKDDFGHAQVVFASDNCGQLEIVSLISLLLEQRSKTLSLVVTAHGAKQLTRQLQHCLPAYRQRIVTLGYQDLDEKALIWVVDAEILSDRLLQQIKDKPSLMRRIGFVTWWQMHEYSGVMAANLWAITRRLYRLLRFHGCTDSLTLALLRTTRTDAQQGRFVTHLLPHTNPDELTIKANATHACSLYSLNAKPDNQQQYLLLHAAKTSIQGYWSTYLDKPEFITDSEMTAFAQEQVNGKNIGEQLVDIASVSGVRLLQLQEKDVLDLRYIVNQGGRECLDLTTHYIGITASLNPYANYWLNRLQNVSTSRRLVCAESSPAIIERHLLQGLNELPDTRGGLLQRSMWKEKTVDSTLESLAKEGRLSKKEVRFLDMQGRLEIDLEYQSTHIPVNKHYPLNTAGSNLLEVREVAADGGINNNGVRLRVDPERRLIKAYPNRIFISEDQRYRIRDWNKQTDNLTCFKEAQSLMTWRIHTARLELINKLPETESSFLGRGGCLERLAVTATYQEEVTGYIEWSTDPHRQFYQQPGKHYLASPLRQEFKCTALLIRLERPPEETNALPSLCQVMRYVLPVHLGVEEDTLEVVSLDGKKINGKKINHELSYGIAIVDLYPNGGIGLINAIYDDNNLLLNLLKWARDWLNESQDDILQTPACLAANPDIPPEKQAALNLLNQIID